MINWTSSKLKPFVLKRHCDKNEKESDTLKVFTIHITYKGLVSNIYKNPATQ